MDRDKICKLRDVYRAITTFEAEIERIFDLNINEVMLLCTLNERDRLTSSEIAEALWLSNSNASKVITSIEKQRLIKRIVDKADKRQMHFSLTQKGKTRLDEIKCRDIALPQLLRSITN